MPSLALPAAVVALLAAVLLPVLFVVWWLVGQSAQACQPSVDVTSTVAVAPAAPGARPRYSQAQMQSAIAKYDPSVAQVFGAIGMGETSGWDFPSTNGTGEYHGPWAFQVAANALRGVDMARLDRDLDYAAAQTVRLYHEAGWQPWSGDSPPTGGNYLKFMGGVSPVAAVGASQSAQAPTTTPTTSLQCTQAGQPGALSGGGVASGFGWVFPLRTTQAVLRRGSQTATGQFETWCFTSQNNCHHDYNAADLMAPTGTPVLAPVAGTAVTVHQGLGPGCAGLDNRGDTISFKGDDGMAYFMGHMLTGSLVDHIHVGDHFAAGTQLGLVGTVGDAQCTVPHLHIQQNPAGQYGNQSDPLNVQPVLVKLFARLPA